MSRYPWARWGDLNAFFGLILDNVAVMIVLVVLVTGTEPAAARRFSREFVLTQMIPGTALGVVLGDLAYTWMAFRLARRTGRRDVTAMPLGLDAPSTFAIGALVLLPALNDGMTRYGLDHGQAMVFGWHVGAVVLLMVGAFKSVLAPLGGKIRRWIPRAGLLGSLAAIALALIAFLPLWTHIAAVPVVGFLSLTVILVALVSRHRLPGRVPGALAAVLLGVAVYYLGDCLSHALAWPIVPPPVRHAAAVWRAPELLPGFSRSLVWWQRVFLQALADLPVMLPFALATIVGGIDCTESAAAAGDEYDTRTILLTEGLASVAAGGAVGVQSLRCLANGFIVTSLLWASALAAMLDGKLLRSAGYLAVAGVCSLLGIIHSPLRPAAIALPQHVLAQMSQEPAIRCQSPYHWAAAYALAAALLILLHLAHHGNDFRSLGDRDPASSSGPARGRRADLPADPPG
jgi:AGZA family xanthine/uracil permease-like MFS transporter